MKILIIYGTKSGTTEKCAKELQKQLTGKADILNLNKIKKINLSNYKLVVIGTPIYAGMINSKIKTFCKKDENLLNEIKIAFYTCGLGDKKESFAALSKQVPLSLIERALKISHFDGELHLQNQSFFLKFITKAMLKNAKKEYEINYSEMKSFIKEINNYI